MGLLTSNTSLLIWAACQERTARPRFANVALGTCAALLIATAVRAQLDPPPPAAKRHILELAAREGRTTVAIGVSYAWYGAYDENAHVPVGVSGDVWRRDCASMPPQQRYRIPECVAIEEFDAFKVADLNTRAALYLPGAMRERSLGWYARYNKDLAEHRQGMRNAEMRFLGKFRWRAGVRIEYRIENTIGQDTTHSGSLLMKYDESSQRYWAHSFNNYTDYAHHSVLADMDLHGRIYNNKFSYSELRAFPREGHLWRVDPERRRKQAQRINVFSPTTPEEVAAAGDEHAFYMYVRDEALELPDLPFVQQDDAALDDAGRALKRQITRLIQVDMGALPLDAVYEVLDPSSQAAIKTNRKFQEGQKRAGMAESVASATLDALFYAKMGDLLNMRLVTRVHTDNGIAWYGWVAANRQRGPFGPDMGEFGERRYAVVELFQVRDADEMLKLSFQPNRSMERDQFAHKMLIFYGDVDKMLVRPYAEAALAPQEQP